MSAFEVLDGGLFAIVVDRGRFGFRGEGVATGGPLDAVAFAAANLLAGNDADAAALEIALGGLKIRFDGFTRFALAGAACAADLDGARVDPWGSYEAHAEATLTLRRPRASARTYLAVAGGIGVPRVLNSRDTNVAASFGGYEGRALRAGDRAAVRIGSAQSVSARRAAALQAAAVGFCCRCVRAAGTRRAISSGRRVCDDRRRRARCVLVERLCDRTAKQPDGRSPYRCDDASRSSTAALRRTRFFPASCSCRRPANRSFCWRMRRRPAGIRSSAARSKPIFGRSRNCRLEPPALRAVFAGRSRRGTSRGCVVPGRVEASLP